MSDAFVLNEAPLRTLTGEVVTQGQIHEWFGPAGFLEPTVNNMRVRTDLAVAVGGLAGNNAHGAGVLAAFQQSGILPHLITCTSGQIIQTHRLLTGQNVYETFKNEIAELQPFGDSVDLNIMFKNFHAMLTADLPWLKKMQIRPSIYEFPSDIRENILKYFAKYVESQGKISFYKELSDIWPSRSLVSQRDHSFFQKIADDFNNETYVGVIFNAYDYMQGAEYIYMNNRAAELTGHVGFRQSLNRPWVRFAPITAGAVKSALQLYQYSVANGPTQLDGAYFRDIILGEIPGADNNITKICVARPMANQWLGSQPASLAQVQDLQTEVNFLGSYIGEREKIRLINQHAARLGLTKVGIFEVNMNRQRGWWDFALEDAQVLNDARRRGQLLIPYL